MGLEESLLSQNALRIGATDVAMKCTKSGKTLVGKITNRVHSWAWAPCGAAGVSAK
jgi:hypothetical protein